MTSGNHIARAAVPPTVEAVAQIVIHTGDLTRFRSFYEGLLGLPHVITLRMARPPHLRYAVFSVGPQTALRAIEVPGYEPARDETTTRSSQPWIDHFSLLVRDESVLHAVRDRLVAAGSSSGEVAPFGPYLTVVFRNPDDVEGQIACPWSGFDPTRFDDELIECSFSQWTSDLLSR
jgi:catechol 2,3-dioxygenase-like lactoylglutathione lyase family enzyme